MYSWINFYNVLKHNIQFLNISKKTQSNGAHVHQIFVHLAVTFSIAKKAIMQL
jgi:hypothetical protein